MAAKKKTKASKKKAAKTKTKAPAKKSPIKKAKKTGGAKKPAKKTKAKKTVKAPVKKATVKKAPAKKSAPPAKKKQIVGEGDYEATRKFDKDQSSFVQKNKAKIPEMAKEAEQALDGPEGDDLREAEAKAAGRSRDEP